jgi:hypothetical protein
VKRLLIPLAAVGFISLFWKEFPALRRYLRIERM